MFIRASKQCDKKTNREYTTHRLVESYRNQSNKVRQRTLLNLGSHFDFPKTQWKIIADRVEEILSGQGMLFEIDSSIEKEAQRISKILIKKHADLTDEKNNAVEKIDHASSEKYDIQSVDVNSLEHKDVRKVGNEYVAYHAANQLNLINILKDQGFNDRQVYIAVATIISRLVQPGSELRTHRYLTEHSALDELMGVDFSNLPLKNLYKISDQLLKKKEKIEAALYQREKDLFNLNEIVTLYDITNTYFEGCCCLNEKAKHGRSKEKRNDCLLVALGIVLGSSGFPKKSSIFPGNISEPKTMQEMLGNLGATKNSTIVMDAGFSTEENITWLKENDYQYIVVSRKQKTKEFSEIDSVLVKKNKNNEVRATLIENNESNEMELYCHSTAKEAKSKSIINKFSKQYESELEKLSSGLTKKGSTKRYDKVMEKLGRLKEKYKRIGKLYSCEVETDQENKFATKIFWKRNEISMSSNGSGTYCLRTNRKDLNAQTFWDIYTTLTNLESAFRSLKSELGMRPVYHQKTERVDGHIFISILAYHLLHTIRYQLKQKGFHESWQTLRQLLQTQCRITSTLKLENGKMLVIRKSNSPDTNQAAIYKALGIKNHPGSTEKTYL